MSLVAIVLLSLVFGSTDDLTLNVNVGDAGGNAIGNAVVILENTPDQRKWEGSTSETGSVHFERLPIGSYILRIIKEGYYSGNIELRLEASQIVDFKMVTLETRHDEVDVIARPEAINIEAVSTQQNVNNAVIQSLPYTGRLNFLNALTLMPGVLRDNSGAMHIDGSRSDQIRYEIDGINVTDPNGGLESNIPIDAIESVDLDLAGYSAQFGKGSGGIVRIQSKFVGDKMTWGLTDFLPGINFNRKTISDLSPRFLLSGPIVRSKAWFMYSGTLHYVRSFVEDLPNGMNRQNQTNADQFAKFQWNLGESHVLTMSLLGNSEYFGNFGLSTLRPIEATTNNLQRGTTAAVSNRNIVQGTLLETTVQWTHNRDSELAKGTSMLVVQPTGWSGNYYTDQLGRSDHFHIDQSVGKEQTWGHIVHRFKVGGEFDYVVSDLTVRRRPYELLDDNNNLQLLVQFDGPDSAEVRNRDLGFFAQDRMTLTPRIQFEIGARVDRESVIGKMNAAPRMAGSFLPRGDNRSKISGGVGVFYDNVALNNFQLARMQRRITTLYNPDGTPAEISAPTAIGIAPNLDSPYGLHWNAAWDQEWAPRWVSRINLIEKRGIHQSRLAAVPSGVPGDDSFNLLFNSSGKSNYRAVEFSLDRPIRTNLRVLASYTYSRATARPTLSIDFPDPALEQVGQAPVGWNAQHRFLSWGYFPFFAKTSASYAVEARSGFPFSAVDQLGLTVGPYNGRTMPMYFSTNLSIEKEIPMVFSKRVAIRLSVTNLFNQFNPRFVDANIDSATFLHYSESSGRAFSGRVRLLKK